MSVCCVVELFVFVVICFVCMIVFSFFFFFKQKTAYEMRISDWSSDVCSSDLKVASAMSIILVIISIALVAVKGLNLGIDFVGGQSVRVEFKIGRASCRERVCQYV